MDDDDLKSASDSIGHQESSAYRPKNPRPERNFPKKLIIVIIVLLLTAAFGFAVFKFVLNKHSTSNSSNGVTNQTSQEKPVTVGDDVPEAALSETYTSPALLLSIKYPKTWKVSEAAGGIRIESPKFNYLPAQASSLDGNFRIYIRQGARPVDGKYIGSGIAIKPSEKLVYTRPANGQRLDTWLSSFGYDNPNLFSFFLIAGNFELKQNDTLGPNYGKEPDAYIVAGGYSSSTAADDLAMNSVTLDYYATTKAYRQGLAIIASLQLN